MRELAIVLLNDGRPGHYHLSEGICTAIARRRPVAVTRVAVARPSWLPGRVLSAAMNVGGALARPVPGLLGLDIDALPEAGLVVSAGGDTLAASVAIRRSRGCPNIFYGSLRRYRCEDFSLVLTSYAENAGRPNHAMTLKPAPFDPAALPQPVLVPGARPRYGLLIGGDSGTVRYTAGDWAELIALIGSDRPDAPVWTVSNSRRTPAHVSDRLAGLAARPGGELTFIDVRHAGSGTLHELLASSDAVAVTVDSSSMISEAIWARRRVVALAPRHAGLPPLEQGYRTYLSGLGVVAVVPLAGISHDRLDAALSKVRALPDNPLDALAELIEARLPQLFA
jgi:uncharacterized protein